MKEVGIKIRLPNHRVGCQWRIKNKNRWKIQRKMNSKPIWDTRSVSSSSIIIWLIPIFKTLLIQMHHSPNTNLVESLSVVDADDWSNHFWDDDHVTKVSLNNGWFFQWWSLLLGFAQFLDQSQWFAFQSTWETSTGTAVHQFNQLITENRNKKSN